MPFVASECKVFSLQPQEQIERAYLRVLPLLQRLHAHPSANIGFRLSDQELRVLVGLRLGADVVSGHICTSGNSATNGYHGLLCRRSAGCLSRHHAVNDVP